MPVVFISHNLPAVLELCTRAIVIDRGTVRFDGDPAEAVGDYRRGHRRARQPHAPGGSDLDHQAELLDERGRRRHVFRTGDTARRSASTTRRRSRIARPQFAVDIHRADGVYCAGINTLMDRAQLRRRRPDAGLVELDDPEPRRCCPGSYLASVGILRRHRHGGRSTSTTRAYPFSVMSDRRELGRGASRTRAGSTSRAHRAGGGAGGAARHGARH